MKFMKKLAYRLFRFLTEPVSTIMNQTYNPSSAISQILLQMTYKFMRDSNKPLPSLNEVGFKAYSQTDEDGILLYIFSLLGTKNKKSVELGAGDGVECNTANLIINHGWSGLLVDCDSWLCKRGKDFYRKNKSTYVYPPTFVCAWITRDNINRILKDNGFEGEIDLLSIDLKGIDYWIWEAIEAIQPRVVVVDYQDILGPDKALAVPYSDDFKADSYPTTYGMPNFSGASLLAFVKLAKKKGYRLIGCNRYGFNAFFVRMNLGVIELPEISVSECFSHPKTICSMRERFPIVKDFPWIEV